MRFLRLPGLLVVAAWLLPAAAKADGIEIIPAVFYSSSQSKADTVESSETDMFLNLTGGFFASPSFLIGAKYLSMTTSFDAKTDLLSSAKSSIELSGFGITMGYVGHPGFTLLGTYFVNPEKKLKGGVSDTTFIGKMAYAFEGGYQWRVGSVGFGPLLSYVHFEYGKVKDSTGTTDLFGSYADSVVQPYFAFWFKL